ncbi:MFS transporter [Brevibacillus borstelensis]|jgi:MFS family permease|uniref:MFS transporter n=1 Tax=Brevibacillus TaxID=55080 RepID=UPI000F0774E2|nr:MFS transporter [Brevibacillus borstelensis]MCC0565766.1 MFS transporter [Brevibacillus borstelensis]MCM3560370.1 MFS transporter [Brevibacillus borstelensis]MED1876523.1 MFS transporter [Brevibacillus borstelensis]MED1884338.1 MFS transporter [Brevibacillus borstelensis]RNB63881.1 MFS transporter [Brevibacillus borstelensis]
MISPRAWLHRYPREAWLFLAASFLNSSGSAFMWPLTTLYVHTQLHRSMTEAGFVLMLQSLAGIVGQFTGGSLFHRVGAKRLIVGSLLLQACCMLGILLLGNWYLYIGFMIGLGFLFNVSNPAIQAFIGFRWKEQRRELFNIVYVGNNLGMAVGTALAGVIAAISFHFTFLFNSVSTFLFAGFFFFFMRNMSHDELVGSMSEKTEKRSQGSMRLLLRYQIYLFMALGSTFIFFSTTVWNTGVAPHLTSSGMPLAAYSWLWTINGIVIFAGQPVTSWLKRLVKQNLSSQLVASAIAYGGGFGFMLFFHDNYAAFIIGMIITTFGEMLIAPTVPTFISEKTGESAPFYLGAVGAITSGGRLLGPLFFGQMYDAGGIVPALTLATVVSSAAVVLCLIHASFHRERKGRVEASGKTDS